MNDLISFDKTITLCVNNFHTAYFDSFFYLYTDLKTWIPLLLLVMYVVWREWGIKALYVYLSIALVILFADQLSSSIIKPLFERPRPTHDESISHLIHIVNGYKGGKYGFVSSHAANSFAFATLTSLIFKRKIYTFCILFWAFLTSYSRVYLGVHYVGDIFFGAIIGLFFAILLYYIANILLFVSPIKKNVILSNLSKWLIIIGFVVLHIILIVSSYVVDF